MLLPFHAMFIVTLIRPYVHTDSLYVLPMCPQLLRVMGHRVMPSSWHSAAGTWQMWHLSTACLAAGSTYAASFARICAAHALCLLSSGASMNTAWVGLQDQASLCWQCCASMLGQAWAGSSAWLGLLKVDSVCTPLHL